MRVAASAFHHRAAAAEALSIGRWNDALHHASVANRLHRTERGDALLLVARMVQAHMSTETGSKAHS
jgi:hypothetical protein